MKNTKCPICGFAFAFGILGWDSHIARVENHPAWHPKVISPDARKKLFQREHMGFFNQARTAYRHKSGTMPKVEIRRQAKVG